MFYILYYLELIAKKIWPLIQKDEELIKYFPKYKPQLIPNKDFHFKILWGLIPVEGNQLQCTAMKNNLFMKTVWKEITLKFQIYY